jgi:hypothetical protein
VLRAIVLLNLIRKGVYAMHGSKANRAIEKANKIAENAKAVAEIMKSCQEAVEAINRKQQQVINDEERKLYEKLSHAASDHMKDLFKELHKAHSFASSQKKVLSIEDSHIYKVARAFPAVLSCIDSIDMDPIEKFQKLRDYKDNIKAKPSLWSRIKTTTQQFGLVAGAAIIGAAIGAIVGAGFFSGPAAAIGAGIGVAIATGAAGTGTYLYSKRKSKAEKSALKMTKKATKVADPQRTQEQELLDEAPLDLTGARLDFNPDLGGFASHVTSFLPNANLGTPPPAYPEDPRAPDADGVSIASDDSWGSSIEGEEYTGGTQPEASGSDSGHGSDEQDAAEEWPRLPTDQELYGADGPRSATAFRPGSTGSLNAAVANLQQVADGLPHPEA